MGEQHAHVVSPVVPTDAPGTIFPDRFYKDSTIKFYKDFTIKKAPASSNVSLILYEEDAPCNQATLFPTGNGSDGCGDWATATKHLSYETGTYNTTEQVTFAQDAGRLAFAADVKVEVVIS